MIHRRLEIGATYRVKSQMIDVIDKGAKKGAVLVSRKTGYLVNEKGEESPAFYVDTSIFARSLGGSGAKSNGKSATIPSAPKRNPDVIIKDKTFLNQALFYRLNSDPNPLHVDPNIAALAGFERPIIHGISSIIQEWRLMEQWLDLSSKTYWQMTVTRCSQSRPDSPPSGKPSPLN